VSIDGRHPGKRVPGGFLGLSFELSSLPVIASYAGSRDFVGMLRSLGPGLLRFGGVTADTRAAWVDSVTRFPPWASVAIGARDLRSLRRLASEVRWHILLTVGLVHYDPPVAAREASAAKKALGRWLVGIEIGNEPDAYARHGFRTRPWTFTRYEAEVGAYRRAIAKVAAGIPLVGPDLSGSRAFANWGRRAAIREKPALLTAHHYPLRCHELPLPPTIARLLAPPVRRREEHLLRAYAAVSRADKIRLRMDEANTVSCGGVAGISNTFASALWAVDFIARAMAAGVAGINLQGNPANCLGYTPVCAPTPRQLAEGAVIAQPEWYALLLTRALLGDRPVHTTVAPSRPNVDVIALRPGGGGLHVVIVDDEPVGTGPLTVNLRVGARFGVATVLPLTAPSPDAGAGVRLGDRAVGRGGGWRVPDGLRRYPNRAGTITLPVSPETAMLVTVAPRRGGAPNANAPPNLSGSLAPGKR
jgi:hypothetical protein